MYDVLHHPPALGKNLRILRRVRERSLSDVAQAVGISKALLSLIEQGKRRCSFELLYQLLQYYRYSLGQFISEAQHHNEVEGPYFQPTAPRQTPMHHLLLAGNRNYSSPTLLLLRPLSSSSDLEFLRLILPPRSSLPAKTFFRFDGQFRGYMLQGKLLIESSDASELVIHQGEEFAITLQHPFRFRNYTDSRCEALLIFPYPWL